MEETCVWRHVKGMEDGVTAPGHFNAASCSSGEHLHAQTDSPALFLKFVLPGPTVSTTSL